MDQERLQGLVEWLGNPGRLYSLRRSNLLDAPRLRRLDRVTQNVRRELDVAAALVTLVDEHRQFFLSAAGLVSELGVRETGHELSLCKLVGWKGEPFRVPDVRALDAQEVACDLLSIEALGVRAYLGVPLRSPDGWTLGSLCAIDARPRAWADAEQQLLEDHATIVEAVLLHHGHWEVLKEPD